MGIAAVVDPSATNIGYVGLATPAENRARGLGKSGSTEHVRVSVDAGGIVTVLLGTVPQGQGHATVARQVVAGRLGLPLDQVHPVVEMDTATTPWTVTSGSYSSRFAPLLTSALADAADRIAATLRQAAAVMLGAAPEDLELAGGQVRCRHEPDRAVPFRRAAGLVHWDPGALPEGVPASLYAEAAFSPPQAKAPSADDQINSSLCYGFVADVVASASTRGRFGSASRSCPPCTTRARSSARCCSRGRCTARSRCRGGALLKEMRYAGSGQPVSGTFMDYLCPTAAEVSFPLVSEQIETPSPYTRLGAKGCGEGSSMSVPVALANAIADALAPLGIELNSLPVHGNVLHELLERHGVGHGGADSAVPPGAAAQSRNGGG